MCCSVFIFPLAYARGSVFIFPLAYARGSDFIFPLAYARGSDWFELCGKDLPGDGDRIQKLILKNALQDWFSLFTDILKVENQKHLKTQLNAVYLFRHLGRCAFVQQAVHILLC